MSLYHLRRESPNPAALASWLFGQFAQAKDTVPTHERSRSSNNCKCAIVKENVSSEILEKPLRRSSTKEGTTREMLWIVWDPTPGRSLVNERDRPRMKFYKGQR